MVTGSRLALEDRDRIACGASRLYNPVQNPDAAP
jgi:hypothetical protein